jgi:hypothetical protein
MLSYYICSDIVSYVLSSPATKFLMKLVVIKLIISDSENEERCNKEVTDHFP